MKKAIPSSGASEWLDRFLPEQLPANSAAQTFQPILSRFERKAMESTRVAREVTEAATEQRQTVTARLRGARLKWEADARALEDKKPIKKRKSAEMD